MKRLYLFALAWLACLCAVPANAATCNYVQLDGKTVPCVGTQEQTNPLTITDGSGTIATGGTSQQVFAANTARRYLFCQNPVAASETLFVNIGAVAASGTSYELAAGGTLTFITPAAIPTGAVNVVAATSTHAFICKQG